jgi:cell division protease FtsH
MFIQQLLYIKIFKFNQYTFVKLHKKFIFYNIMKSFFNILFLGLFGFLTLGLHDNCTGYVPSYRQSREPRLISNSEFNSFRKYPLSRNHYEHYLKRLNSKNITTQTNEILNGESFFNSEDENQSDIDFIEKILKAFNETGPENSTTDRQPTRGPVRIIINKGMLTPLSSALQDLGMSQPTQTENDNDNEGFRYDENGNVIRTFGRNKNGASASKRSKHFEVITKSPINFSDIGGYQNIKLELNQCIDILSNYTKYAPYNVRVPKGLIFEGPPGNGKTLLAKALAGEAKTGFIAVSGSEFQEKYVGVGASRIRELFQLAKENIPCIIFIDEIDALGRKRSSDGDTSGNERDSTLNELLVALDGFKNTSGIFVIGATNRADLLDSALTRPGRIDKRIFIGNPDRITRKAILDIHSRGKPFDSTVVMEDVIDVTDGLSGAQIENLVNEAMLNALRYDRKEFTSLDLDVILNKMIAGWQPSDHQFTTDMIDQIAIHELGHAVVGMLSKHHSKMTKVIINLSAPKSPAYTIFESSSSSIMTREALFEHLMILLAGRIAEETFFGISVSTGAINDFEEALKLAEKMVCYYGMGKKLIYPNMSEKYKEIIDDEVATIINDAYGYSEFIIRNSKELIREGADILKENGLLKADTLIELMNSKYKSVLALKI